MIRDPSRLARLASRIGFRRATIRPAGMGRRSLVFDLPERPPMTRSRRMDSAFMLNPDTDDPDEVEDAPLVPGKVTIRFPRAPEEHYTEEQVADAARDLVVSRDDYPPVNVRLNPVVKRYAVHYDIEADEMREVEPEAFLRETFDIAQDFNERMEELY